MNGAQFHDLINHFPILFPLAGFIALVIGILIKSEPVKRVGYFIMILGGISTFFAMNSGESAEHFLKESLGSLNEKKRLIHKHEELAETFSILNYSLSSVAFLALWMSWAKNKIANFLQWIVVLTFFATIYFGYQTGSNGGKIIHTELRE